MLSNPTTTRPPRQRQHRRQNSTPSAFEGGTAQNMPSGINRRQAVAHRRGLSLDIRRFQMTPPTSERQDNMVSMSTNNTGLANTPQHRVLREAQQQRTQARPGPHPNHNHNPYLAMRHGNTENFTMSPDHTPHSQRFSASSPFNPSSAPFDPYGEQLNLMMQRNQGSYGDNLSSARNFELFTVENAQSMSSYTGIPESPSQGWMADGGNATLRRSTRRISDGIMDRVAIFENMNGEEAQAPSTPPNYNENAYLPPTPIDTPHDRAGKQEARAARFAEDYDDSMEETLKPTRTRGQPRAQDVFQEMRQQAQMASAVPSPPQSTPLPNSKTFNAVPMQTTDFLSMNSFKDEFMEGFDTTLSRDNFLPEEPSQHTTPETHHMGGFASGCDSRSEYPNYQEAEAAHLQQRSMHRRTESVASIASAASIASINIEETKTETGVTTEEIAQFIQSPDASDGKWVCLFEECGKEFGRKENIKSHVQTHLNDRQYQCPTCKKCFVRQHDLKRHAKIHTGIKPYPCDCGNSFARHDALTRHRQRGMCIGAFDGIVRKTVKRGRPKKHRPDMETRMEKSARTRRKNNMSVSSMSSFSGYSDSSVANSPEPDFCMTDELMDMGPVDSSMHGMAALSSAPMPMMVSRRNVAAVVASPSVASVHSYVSPEAIMDKEPELPVNSAAGQWSSAPPSLTRSSSPPAVEVIPMSRNASSNMDSDELVDNIEHGEMAASAAANNTLPMNLSQQEEDLMLQFTHDDDLVPLERDLMGKFEEEFNMFTNHDDPFFGNS